MEYVTVTKCPFYNNEIWICSGNQMNMHNHEIGIGSLLLLLLLSLLLLLLLLKMGQQHKVGREWEHSINPKTPFSHNQPMEGR